jgi:hypothetical protein
VTESSEDVREPEYDENGVDRSLVRQTLAMTPEERIRTHDALLADVEAHDRGVLWEIGVDATPALVDAQDDALDVGATKALELHGEVLRRPEADDPEQKPVCGVSPANLEVRALFVQFRGRYGVPRSPAQRERACRSPDARGGNQGKRSPEEVGFAARRCSTSRSSR